MFGDSLDIPDEVPPICTDTLITPSESPAPGPNASDRRGTQSTQQNFDHLFDDDNGTKEEPSNREAEAETFGNESVGKAETEPVEVTPVSTLRPN